MRPIDRTRDCDDGKQRVIGLDERVPIVIHRTSMGGCASEVSAAYQQHPVEGAKTGWQMPFFACILPSGFIEQSLRLGDYGAHAKAWGMGIGVALIGDYREREPPPEQWRALVALCHVMSGWIGGAARVYTHDEIAETRNRCPGRGIDIDKLRAEIRTADMMRIICAGYTG